MKKEALDKIKYFKNTHFIIKYLKSLIYSFLKKLWYGFLSTVIFLFTRNPIKSLYTALIFIQDKALDFTVSHGDEYINKIRAFIDFLLKDHFKIKSEFVLICLMKIFFTYFFYILTNNNNDSEIIPIIVNGFLYFTFAAMIFSTVIIFRNAIILFNAMWLIFYILFVDILNAEELITLFKIPITDVSILTRIDVLLIISFLVASHNNDIEYKKKLKNNINKEVSENEDPRSSVYFLLVAISITVLHLLDKYHYNYAVHILSFLIASYLAIYSANMNLKNIEKNPYNGPITSLFLKVKILDIIKIDFGNWLKLIPSILLYSTFYTLIHWTMTTINSITNDNDIMQSFTSELWNTLIQVFLSIF